MVVFGETSRSRAIPGKGRARIAGGPGDPEERGDRRSQGRQKGGRPQERATGEGEGPKEKEKGKIRKKKRNKKKAP